METKVKYRVDIIEQYKKLVGMTGNNQNADGENVSIEARRIPDPEGGRIATAEAGSGGCFFTRVDLTEGGDVPEGVIEVKNNPYGSGYNENYVERFEVKTFNNLKVIKKTWFSPDKGFHKVKIDAQTGKVIHETHVPEEKQDKQLIEKTGFDI